LISAYKTATEEALRAATVIEEEVIEAFSLQYDYPATAEVMRLVKDFDLQLLHQDFSDRCTLQGGVPLRHLEMLKERIALMNAMGGSVDLVFMPFNKADL
jgi:putative IMPACT (imprinted ancient) family translation regulator